MKTGSIIKIMLISLASLILAACASTPGGGRTSASTYSGSNPVCVGAEECAIKMAAARSWVTNNTGFGFRVDTDNLLETGGWGVRELTAVRVSLAPIGGGRSWLMLEIACGSDSSVSGYEELGCPDPSSAGLAFSRAVSAAH